MWFASHLKFILFIGMGLTFSLHILFLFENGELVTMVTAKSKLDLHSHLFSCHIQTLQTFLKDLYLAYINHINP